MKLFNPPNPTKKSIQQLTIFIFLSLSASLQLSAQTDSLPLPLHAIPQKYFNQVDSKIEKYSSRITSKTKKTLNKLSRWENHIHNLLQKISPETAQHLFANKGLTFSGLLEKLNAGGAIAANSHAQYNEYRDQLATSIRYLQTGSAIVDSIFLKPATVLSDKLDSLDKTISESEAVEQFIKQRKKELFAASLSYIGKSKYLQKINKESYYYVETLKNYKEIFSDRKRSEATVKAILNKIPAFKKFTEKNSMLASIFNLPSDYGSAQSLAGLQTRSSVNAMIQDRLAAGGPNAREAVSQNIQQAQSQLSQLKDKYLNAGKGSTSDDLPDFTPNTQKSKTFLQRTEFTMNIQFPKNQISASGIAEIGISVGYKLNDKSLIGLGMSYKLGYDKIQHLSFSQQSVGFRTFIDWKLKLNLFVSGGMELNDNTAFKKLRMRKIDQWQSAGLIGLTKKLPSKSKYIKKTQLQLLYDMLHRNHTPVSQPIIFRMGNSF